MTRPRVLPEPLIRFAAAVASAHGMEPEDATLLADSLVQADLWGHQSHGVMRLSWYMARLRSGAMRAETDPAVILDGGAVSVVDGNDGVGQVIASRATRMAMEKAKAHGIGAVSVRNSNHFGTAMYFAQMAPPEGCIALLTTNASPAMAPWGGRRKLMGTNPWSVAAPAGRFGTMVMDIANTTVARGKVYLARQRGERIPLGWAMDAAGQPTTDPEAALGGLILPMAGHKGYAISVMMDVLSGVLSGSSFGSSVNGPYQPALRSGCGHLVIALDIKAFLPLAAFNDRMEKLIDELKSAELAAGHEEVFFPGEIEARQDQANRRDGLALPDETVRALDRLAQEAKLETLLPW